MSERVVRTFRERTRASADHLLGVEELNYGETVLTCHVCGYAGIVADEPEAVNAADSSTDDTLVCHVCDDERDA